MLSADHPTKLVLTLHSASLGPGPAMRNVHAVVTAGDKSFKTEPCRCKTTAPTWDDATCAFDISAKTHLSIHVQLVGSKSLIKRDLGHFVLNLSDHRLAKEGTHSLSCQLVDGCEGVVNASMSIFREPHPIRDWALREVAGSSPHRPCHALLDCVPSWSTREALFKNACGQCFLTLVETHSMCDDTFTAKELVNASAHRDRSSSIASHATDSHATDSEDDHHDFAPYHDGHYPSNSPSLKPHTLSGEEHFDTDTADAAPCPSIEEWMQARHPTETFHFHAREPPASTSFHTTHPALFQLLWLLPLLAVVLHQWLVLACRSHISA